MRTLGLASAAPVLVVALAGALPVSAPPGTAVEPARYVRVCDAIVNADRAALKALLTDDFTSRDVSGKVEGRAAFIGDVADPGPVVLKRCAFDVRSREETPHGERDRVFWKLEGTYSAAGSTKPASAIFEEEDVWVWRGARWQLRSETTSRLKQWLDGEPEMTQTYVPPLTAKEKAAVVADVRTYAHPLLSAYPGGAESDLAPILRAAGSARVVAMGEGTHGTSEFFALKDRVFRYRLVVHRGAGDFDHLQQRWHQFASEPDLSRVG